MRTFWCDYFFAQKLIADVNIFFMGYFMRLKKISSSLRNFSYLAFELNHNIIQGPFPYEPLQSFNFLDALKFDLVYRI